MSLLKTTALFTFCALLAAPAMAQPTVTIDLVRSGGVPVLSASGDWQYVLSVTPGTIASGDTEGDALAIGGGVTLTDSALVASSAAASGDPLGFPTTDNDEFDLAAPYPAPAGFSFATGTAGVGGNLPEGVIEGTTDSGSFLDGIFVGLGSDPLLAGTYPVLFFEAVGPATTGSLTTSAAFAGEVAQATSPTASALTAVADSFTATVLPGDGNFDGVVDFVDVAVVSDNFGTGDIWTTGDFDNNGTVDFVDVAIISDNFNATGPAPVTVPEPSTVVLVLAAACGLIACRNRK